MTFVPRFMQARAFNAGRQEDLERGAADYLPDSQLPDERKFDGIGRMPTGEERKRVRTHSDEFEDGVDCALSGLGLDACPFDPAKGRNDRESRVLDVKRYLWSKGWRHGVLS